MMGIMTSKKHGASPETLIPAKLKVDTHLVQTAKLVKQLADPVSQVNISGKNVNVGFNQQLNSGMPVEKREKTVEKEPFEVTMKASDEQFPDPKLFE